MLVIKPPKNYKEQRTLKQLKKWAQKFDILIERIPEQRNQKTPDFKAIFPNLNDLELIIEVKEITIPFTIDDECVVAATETGKDGTRFRLADTVRQKIKSARNQLKPYADKNYPTLLLIGMWDAMIDFRLDLDIPIAMRGGGPTFQLPHMNMELISTARGGQQTTDNINLNLK